VIAEPPLDAPDEEWLVWADAMQQVGDPRGELLALGYSSPYVKYHAETLFGRVIGRHIRKGDLVVTRWRRCYADEIELRIDNAADGPQLVVDLANAALPHLRGISIAGIGEVDLSTTLGWFRESSLAKSITSLQLVDDRARAVHHLVSRDFEPGPNLVDFGPLAPLWHEVPQLEQLVMYVADPAQIRFQRPKLPALRAFALRSLAWVEGLGDLIANAQWPELRALELRLVESYLENNPDDAGAYRSIYRHLRERDPIGGGVFGGDAPTNAPWRLELVSLFEAIAKLSLERLALTSWADNYAFMDAFAQFVPPPTLVELDFSDSAIDHVGASRLADHVVMVQLKRLVLERVRLPSPKPLEGFGVEITHSCAPYAPAYRYVTGME
jgi:hypothetical protein